jgi:molecular chaperone GrpE
MKRRKGSKAGRTEAPVEAPSAASDPVGAATPDATAQDQAKRAAELEAKVSELEVKVSELEWKLGAAGDRTAALTGERDTWQSKATAIFDQYLRAKADFDGFRRRTERDFEDRVTRGKADFLRALLEVVDNFGRFLQATEKSGLEGGERSFEAFFRGVTMIEQQLMDALLKEGVEPIENPVGKELDPAFHDAVATQDGGGEHGTVVEELQKGYVYNGLVLRPAKVKVIR